MKFTVEIEPKEIEQICGMMPKIWASLPAEVRQQLLDHSAQITPSLVATFMQHAPDASAAMMKHYPDMTQNFVQAGMKAMSIPFSFGNSLWPQQEYSPSPSGAKEASPPHSDTTAAPLETDGETTSQTIHPMFWWLQHPFGSFIPK
ncbi:MAG: hypothetical protein RBR86_01860 [Pseudobdellovibrionaceae bacterium]|nr:hypothetical protein [Pseudobdellovibrionaceae bacterium]